jgi:hypothetical protein
MRTRLLALLMVSSFLIPGREAPDRTDSSEDSAWLERAQRTLAEREHHATDNGHGLQAPNRAHDLRTYFESSGIRVHGRTAGGSPALLRLSLAALGRGKSLTAAAPGTPIAQQNRVEIRRPELVEWYVNSAAGLEQGFTLAERPRGDGSLVLELAVAGARPALRGDAVTFVTGTERRLRYGELVANDADGDVLAAHFEVPAGDRLRLVVDDADATYPIAIDPLLTEIADTQLDGDQTTARLGDSVASAGDVNGDGYADVISSAYFYDAGETDEGAVFVFLGSASGIADGGPATAATQLESNLPDARLGKSVASAGDVNGDGYADVIAGAYFYDTGPGIVHGAAYVFLGSATGIADGDPTTAAARHESNQEDAQAAKSVAGAGDVNGDGYADVLVGSPFYDSGELNEGAAFVYLGNSAGRPVLARQRRGDGSGVAVDAWGRSESATGFAAELRAHHPDGAGRVRVEAEACPAGTAFGDASCTTALTPGWVAVNGAASEVLLSETFSGLTNDALYRWRARVLHAPATGPLPAQPSHGPWRRYQAQSVEADVRVLPEPGRVLALAGGVPLLAALARRRSRAIH